MLKLSEYKNVSIETAVMSENNLSLEFCKNKWAFDFDKLTFRTNLVTMTKYL